MKIDVVLLLLWWIITAVHTTAQVRRLIRQRPVTAVHSTAQVRRLVRQGLVTAVHTTAQVRRLVSQDPRHSNPYNSTSPSFSKPRPPSQQSIQQHKSDV